ncbi:MAG: hypothetical protein KDA87_07095 [Planctomycetales bacterium]|nr:hypothetical protein [Planctomycetales bacterium]
MKIWLPVLFAILTALCWGMYGPTIGNAQSKTTPPAWSPFKPYVFIGIAYLVLAIGGGLMAMKLKGDSYNYSGEAFVTAKWGFLAGCLGALGALFLTSAMMFSKGNALLVMPIVFGGAVSVTALYSTWRLRETTEFSPALWIGIFLVVQGVVITAMNTPHGHGHKKSAGHDKPVAEVTSEATEANH